MRELDKCYDSILAMVYCADGSSSRLAGIVSDVQRAYEKKDIDYLLSLNISLIGSYLAACAMFDGVPTIDVVYERYCEVWIYSRLV